MIARAILLGGRVSVMAVRPGRIKREIDIGLPRPRLLDMIMDALFIALKREILHLLHDELDDEHADGPEPRMPDVAPLHVALAV